MMLLWCYCYAARCWCRSYCFAPRNPYLQAACYTSNALGGVYDTIIPFPVLAIWPFLLKVDSASMQSCAWWLGVLACTCLRGCSKRSCSCWCRGSYCLLMMLLCCAVAGGGTSEVLYRIATSIGSNNIALKISFRNGLWKYGHSYQS